MTNKPNVIFLNTKQRPCGVYQYGLRSSQILRKSDNYNFIYVEVESEEEFMNAYNAHNPIAIIYNYMTMAWLNNSHTIPNLRANNPKQLHMGLYHEGPLPHNRCFNHILYVDSIHPEDGGHFSIPRPLFENNLLCVNPIMPTFSSFGFGFEHKGFDKIVRLINNQFDEAIIRLHISVAHPGGANIMKADAISARCRNQITKPGIQLILTHDYISDDDVLKLLSTSTANIFLYENVISGLSSVVDYALSVDVPFIISKSDMFRHVKTVSPSICIEDRSISEIVNSGIEPLKAYKEIWSNRNFISKYESIVDRYFL